MIGALDGLGASAVDRLLHCFLHLSVQHFSNERTLHFFKRLHAGGFAGLHLHDVVSEVSRNDVTDLTDRLCKRRILKRLHPCSIARCEIVHSAVTLRTGIFRELTSQLGKILAALGALQNALDLGKSALLARVIQTLRQNQDVPDPGALGQAVTVHLFVVFRTKPVVGNRHSGGNLFLVGIDNRVLALGGDCIFAGGRLEESHSLVVARMDGTRQRRRSHRRVFELHLHVAAFVFALHVLLGDEDTFGRKVLHALDQHLLLHALFEHGWRVAHALQGHLIALAVELALGIHQLREGVTDFVRQILITDVKPLFGGDTGKTKILNRVVDDDRQVAGYHLRREFATASDAVHLRADVALGDVGVANAGQAGVTLRHGRVGDARHQCDYHGDGDNRKHRGEQVLHCLFAATEQVEHKSFRYSLQDQRRVRPHFVWICGRLQEEAGLVQSSIVTRCRLFLLDVSAKAGTHGRKHLVGVGMLLTRTEAGVECGRKHGCWD